MRLPSNNEMEIYLAEIRKISEKSPCTHCQHSALILKNGVIIVTAYVGAPLFCIPCKERESIYDKCPMGEGEHKCFYPCPAIYAIARAAKNGVELEGCTIYLSKGTVCENCLPVIIEAGIKMIICDEKLEQKGSKINRTIQSMGRRMAIYRALTEESGIILIGK